MKKTAQGIQLNMFEAEDTTVSLVKVGDNKSSNLNTRRLKIQYGNYANSYRRFAVIKLAGHWLSDFDFHIGDSIELRPEKGEIRILKVPTK